MNFLYETTAAIAESGHVPEDIVFIGSEKTGHQCTWSEFECLADVEYDEKLGGQLVPYDLQIVFSDDHRMTRIHNGWEECWIYSVPFVIPEKHRAITSLVRPADDYLGGRSIEDLNPLPEEQSSLAKRLSEMPDVGIDADFARDS